MLYRLPRQDRCRGAPHGVMGQRNHVVQWSGRSEWSDAISRTA